MKRPALLKYLTLPMLLCSLYSCHEIEHYDNTAQGNFEALWTMLDQHYCFFEEKGINWDSIHNVYESRARLALTTGQLFEVCSDMLAELKDGHVNLSSSFNTFYYRKWWSDYPQNYNQRLVEQYYLNFNWLTAGGLQYYTLPQNIGYIRYASFANPIGDGNLDNVLHHFKQCKGLIIDVRNNGGGNMTNVETLVRRFITEKTLAGYMVHKTGPGHKDFSKPQAYYYSPPDDRPLWRKPVVVLCNRSTFSAANNFVGIMKTLPGVTIAGSQSGGGSGMPLSMELPVGWSLRMSACPVLDPLGHDTENGVAPTSGCEVDLDPQLALTGIDTMIEFAIKKLNE